MPDLAARAERLGYESVFVPDHVVVPVEFTSKYPGTVDGSFPYPPRTPLYDPLIVLATIATATSTIRLGTAVYILALRHPIVTARNVVTLDALSGGRAILGVGVGWLTEEFDALGIDSRTRFSRTEEAAMVLRRLWTESEPSFHGKHFDFDRVHFEPKPLSSPHPPILFGGDSDAALRRALKFGDGWLSGGVAADAEGIAALVRRIDELRTTLASDGTDGWDPDRPFSLSVLHANPSPRDLARMAEVGVDRVVVMPWERNRDAPEAIERLRSMAGDVIDLD
jgi:probable F420-dependent oxidoreductase